MSDRRSKFSGQAESSSPGARFSLAVEREQPLQVVGVINAYCAKLADQAGFEALYLSGAGVANASFGLPDLGMTSLSDVVDEARRITSVTDLPLLVDCDTGWGSSLNIARTVREMERAGVAAIQLEDQVETKRCGHRPGKQLVSTEEMVDRIKAAVDARRDEKFVIMARTDAAANEGVPAAIERSQKYIEAGAGMIFAEALLELDDYRAFTKEVAVPVLANITEFGKTPLFTTEELYDAGVKLVLYPLTAFRAMNKAATLAYEAIRNAGTQKEVIDNLQTRAELYETLDYHTYEKMMDEVHDEKTDS